MSDLRLMPMLFYAALLASDMLSGQGSIVWAQNAPAPTSATINTSNNSISPHTSAVSSKPAWHELNATQKQALLPLLQLWPTMTEPHKRKWLALSQNFAQLSETDKNTLQGRMREWAALTPQQRAQARLNFADAKQLPQDERKTKWEAYQALSAEEKQKLAAQKPVAKVGAAVAIKPVPPEKLATPPAASTSKALPRIASDRAAPSTLLPNTAAAPLNVTPASSESESPTSEQ